MVREKYPIKIKQAMVSRFLSDPEYQIGKFSSENGIPESCLRNWIREAECGILGDMKKPKHFKYWNLSEKFSAILEYEQLSKDQHGKWLRMHGMKAERIKQWKDELSTNLEAQDQKGKEPEENKKIKLLEKELKRKNDALAEASALLFAKKNWMLCLEKGKRKIDHS